MISEKELNLQELELRVSIKALTPAQNQNYQQLEMRYLKRPTTYRRLHLLFPLGIHHFYLQRWVRGTVTLLATLTGIGLILQATYAVYGSMLLLAALLIEIPQFMSARQLVHSYNIRVMARCLRRVKRQQEAERG